MVRWWRGGEKEKDIPGEAKPRYWSHRESALACDPPLCMLIASPYKKMVATL
ncbi:conserved hypothetical protein [Ricinus communis]|uniref:Uncharacterized protein n=1 Tax=Ricinus communis TaxID=3988 RepID=B9SS22_RICCO|nr:conserved hypothetical protein [Ricinus communis]